MPTQFNSNSAKAANADTHDGALDAADLRFQLSHRLQSSLDLVDVLTGFQQMIQGAVPNSGINYRYPEKHIDLSVGSSRAHSACYSLRTARHYLGEIVFYRSRRFAEQELEDIEALIGLLVLPLRNALLYRDALEHSLRDPLTGLGNRKALDEALERELTLAKRAKQPLSLIFADIDYFKRINDTAGHPVGDLFIKSAALAIQATLRQTDQVFRFGGEEYAVVLSATQHRHAAVVAERIRRATAEIRIDSKAGEIGATMSLGVSALRRDDTVDSLLERADEALYLAKASGRNTVAGAED